MKKNYWYSLFWVFSLVILAAGCFEDITGVPWKNAPELYTPKLVVVSYLSPQDSLITVRVSRNAPAVGASTFNERHPVVDQAGVVLRTSARFAQLPYDSLCRCYQLPSRQFPLFEGETYELEVVEPATGLEASAVCTIPADTVLADSVLPVDARSNEEIGYFRLSWPNAPGEADYYALGLTQNFMAGFQTSEFTDFVHGENALGNRLVSEELSIILNSNYESIDVFLYRVDEHYYEYHRSLELVSQIEENPFAEPANVYTNIEGGLGVFAGLNRQYFRLRL